MEKEKKREGKEGWRKRKEKVGSWLGRKREREICICMARRRKEKKREEQSEKL